MSRIDDTFARLRAEAQTGLVTFVTAGDPDMDRSALVLETIDRAGADVLEVGIPFSDPLADGPVIQRSSERALAAGTTLAASLDLVARVRPRIAAAVVVFSYANPVFAMGLETFVQRASDAGVDGVLILDLPIEESDGLRDATATVGMDPIFLLSPTTTETRIRRAATLGRGFLYGISRLGVTGERDTIAGGARELVQRVRRVTSMLRSVRCISAKRSGGLSISICFMVSARLSTMTGVSSVVSSDALLIATLAVMPPAKAALPTDAKASCKGSQSV